MEKCKFVFNDFTVRSMCIYLLYIKFFSVYKDVKGHRENVYVDKSLKLPPYIDQKTSIPPLIHPFLIGQNLV